MQAVFSRKCLSNFANQAKNSNLVCTLCNTFSNILSTQEVGWQTFCCKKNPWSDSLGFAGRLSITFTPRLLENIKTVSFFLGSGQFCLKSFLSPGLIFVLLAILVITTFSHEETSASNSCVSWYLHNLNPSRWPYLIYMRYRDDLTQFWSNCFSFINLRQQKCRLELQYHMMRYWESKSSACF